MSDFTLKIDRTVTRRMRAAAEAGLRDAAEHVLAESKRAVPVDEGDLRNSGRVTVDGLTATVSFRSRYAVRQHENMRLRHEDGGQAKFLEQPMNDAAGDVARIIEQRIRRDFG